MLINKFNQQNWFQYLKKQWYIPFFNIKKINQKGKKSMEKLGKNLVTSILLSLLPFQQPFSLSLSLFWNAIYWSYLGLGHPCCTCLRCFLVSDELFLLVKWASFSCLFWAFIDSSCLSGYGLIKLSLDGTFSTFERCGQSIKLNLGLAI